MLGEVRRMAEKGTKEAQEWRQHLVYYVHSKWYMSGM
jgi:hypothetical protein